MTGAHPLPDHRTRQESLAAAATTRVMEVYYMISVHPEVAYLCAQGFARFRTIMRYVYLEQHAGRDLIATSEIHQAVHDTIPGAPYTLIECAEDLARLRAAGNLREVPDRQEARTLADFTGTQLVYRLTTKGRLVEDLQIEWELLPPE